ncbi:cupredoxin family copper-binding protein [Massilia sp. Dwa41.01b]|uniref:cupredoxin domain-containing protein n=1 Tax=unclassified Massilia TaxID=2609279 RepID=UPI00160375B8|nr:MULTISPECIES: cupredoxin family copper-binding protein [unclassified Massilia]QNA88237.1 cupredoxin family copper-binding protein [Massilia sp. Dwa41.01b]QNA99136.1 cupredoxin family copper-binding protein [Massilia sp. Se16.2.3]
MFSWPNIRVAGTLALLLLGGAAQAAPGIHTVLIDGMRFIPQTLEVKRGDTVVWRNKDPFPHTATAPGGGPASPAIAAGASWKFVARARGRYPYLCTLHRTMTGTLVVK